MKNKFERPELEIIYFESDLDTISVSDNATGDDNDEGNYGWWS